MEITDNLFDYKIGTKREIVNALKPIFGDNFPIEDLRNKIYVGLEYPNEAIRYPAIYITYSEESIHNAGIGWTPEVTSVGGDLQQYRHWRFGGKINFNIMALNPLDRDRIASMLINLLAAGDQITAFQPFFDEVHDEDWVAITLQTERIIPGGESTEAAPWGDPDTQVFSVKYSINLLGEFVTDPITGGLIQISGVLVSPYREGRPQPWI